MNVLKKIVRVSFEYISIPVTHLIDLRIYLSFRDLTMVTPLVYLSNLHVAKKFKNVNGCVIECGVWRGGMIGGIAKLLGPSRKYYLFDSFEGLPPAQEIDGQAAIKWQNAKSGNKYYDNCKAEEKFAREAMKRAGVENIDLIKGFFERTVPGFIPDQPIAILRLDGDWYESTMTCLKHLYPYVAEGGVIMLDDYYTWDGCSRAVHDFLSSTGSIDRLEKSGSHLCFFIKRSGSCPGQAQA
jgi:O-methyltransferase